MMIGRAIELWNGTAGMTGVASGLRRAATGFLDRLLQTRSHLHPCRRALSRIQDILSIK